jgi:hypothetical protein
VDWGINNDFGACGKQYRFEGAGRGSVRYGGKKARQVKHSAVSAAFDKEVNGTTQSNQVRIVAGMRHRLIATTTAITAAGFSLLSPATGVGRCVGASHRPTPPTDRTAPYDVPPDLPTLFLGRPRRLACLAAPFEPFQLRYRSLSQRSGGSLPTRVRAGLHPAKPKVSVMVASSDTATADGLPDEISRYCVASCRRDDVGKINLNRNVPLLASPPGSPPGSSPVQASPDLARPPPD